MERLAVDPSAQHDNWKKLERMRQDELSITEYFDHFVRLLKRTKKYRAYEAKDPEAVEEVVELFCKGLKPDIIVTQVYDSLEQARDGLIDRPESMTGVEVSPVKTRMLGFWIQ